MLYPPPTSSKSSAGTQFDLDLHSLSLIPSRKDATLREVLTTIRNAAPTQPEFRHPLARYAFRAVYADATNRGRYAHKDLGVVYSRDILGEPGTLHSPAPRLLEDPDGEPRELSEREKEERTLEELRFVPGDFLCVAIYLPKSVTASGPTGEITVKAAAAAPPASNGWRSATGPRVGDTWPSASAPSTGTGRGGGHWRGDSNAPATPGGVGRGRGGRGADREPAGRERDLERRVPPRRPDSPPRRGWPDRDRRDRPSRSRSRSPPRRRNARYD